MKIALFSDLHGFLPKIDPNIADYVFIAGDICPDYIVPQQYYWFVDEFVPWLKTIPPTLYIPGNHDFALERFGSKENFYLEQGEHVLPNGDRVYAFCPTICPMWAFDISDKNMEPLLTQANNFDILVCHNPPFGVCDRVDGKISHHVGSNSILKLIQRVQPKLCVFGHIHEGYGTKWVGKTLCVNCAFRDVQYKPRNKYPVIDTDTLEIDFVHL